MNAATAATAQFALTTSARNASVANPRFDLMDSAIYAAASKAISDSWSEGGFYSEAHFSMQVAGETRNFVVRATGENVVTIMTAVEASFE